MSRDECYKPTGKTDYSWCGPGKDSKNPKDYNGLTGILECKKNAEWIKNNSEICLQSFYDGKKCSSYSNKAVEKWKGTKPTDDSNDLKKLLDKMKGEIISEFKKQPKPHPSKPDKKKDEKQSMDFSLGSSLADNLLGDFFNLFKDNKIHDNKTFNNEIEDLRENDKIENDKLWDWYNKH